MYAILVALVAVAAVVDVRRREIPDWIPAAVLVCAVGCKLLGLHPLPAWQLAAGFAAGFSPTFVLFALGGMGGGDVKLSAALGAALGLHGALLFLGLFFVAGALLALAGRLRASQARASQAPSSRTERETAQAPAMLLALLALLPLAWIAP